MADPAKTLDKLREKDLAMERQQRAFERRVGLAMRDAGGGGGRDGGEGSSRDVAGRRLVE